SYSKISLACSKNSAEFFEHANDILEYDGDIELRQSGYLMIADTEKELTQFRKNIEVQHACGIPSRMVSLEEAKEIVPHLNTSRLSGAAYCQKDGFLNPHKTTDAFYKAAKRLGVEFNTFTEVTGVKVENGRVMGVETNKGYIETRIVVNAANAWSQGIAKMVGVDLPLYSERHQILVTEPVDHMQDPMVMAFNLNLYVQQSPHGSFIMGRSDSGEPRDLRRTSSWHFLEEMAKTIDNVLPAIGKLRVVRQWAGLYNMSPDRQPIYDKVEGVEGFYVACGFSGHGFMFGPVTGTVMAEMILGLEPTIDASRLKLSRFAEGNLFTEPSVV
ncbi:MAG: FAD-binding oxidoreductase, partial [Clostridia bacterium]|nr:FAD-binding oxidoreductase [Clostridia bacterium]